MGAHVPNIPLFGRSTVTDTRPSFPAEKCLVNKTASADIGSLVPFGLHSVTVLREGVRALSDKVHNGILMFQNGPERLSKQCNYWHSREFFIKSYRIN